MRAPRLYTRQAGLTLVELMISLALGLLVVLAATALLQNARAAYQDIDDAARVQETGRMALSHLAEALRQAGHLPWETLSSQQASALKPGLLGADDSLDAHAFDPAQDKTGPRRGHGYNQSDLLMIGLLGAPPQAGGMVRNCSGAAVTDTRPQDAARSWVIYSIALGVGNEPELRCRYRGKKGGWTSDAVARGVEAMQLRYALDSDGDGQPDRWLDASAISGDDWRRVRLVRIALLVRGTLRRPAPAGATPRTYQLFGGADNDSAWRYTEKRGEQRLRMVFQTTVFLRNMPVDKSTAP
ncbi:PilW family protein [Herbaspirillum sp. LeCh32-8]|nr:PilW family protein [Herbaspirillum sp. LeCh32-8]